jgi:hypothetical protein
LTVHTANRLVREDGQFGLIAACAAGGQVNLVFFFGIMLFHMIYSRHL